MTGVALVAALLASSPPLAIRSLDAQLKSCVDCPLLLDLEKPRDAAILRAYGYNLRQGWTCNKIHSPWLAGAQALQFQELPAETDHASSFTVLKVSGSEHLWVIPTTTGMLEASHAKSDPHNLAAFNALLASLPRQPVTDADWTTIGQLYMALLGERAALRMPSAKGSEHPCDSHGECTLLFSDRTPRSGERYVRWSLKLKRSVGSGAAKITDVTRHVVGPNGVVVEPGED